MTQVMDTQLARQFERLPPHAVEAEMCLIASMMLDKEMVGQVVQIVSRDSFFQTDHQVLFEVIVKLYEQNKAIDAVIVREELAKRQLLEEVGGVEYLMQILGSVPSAAHGAHYAGIVREKALLRQLIAASNDILRDAYAPHEQADLVLDKAEKRIFEIAQKKVSGAMVPMEQVLHEVFEMIENRGQRGIETGFFEMDDMMNGLQSGEMIIVAARPSMGKTAFAMNVIEHVAADSMLPCAVFSLEMSKQQLAQRMLCSRGQIDAHKLRRGMLSAEEYTKLASVVGELAKAPIWVDDSPGLTPLELRAKARRLKLQHDIKLVMIDYMQLMDNPGPESRQQQISEISRGVKAVARELSIPVICLSQLNRASESRDGHRPRMSDLRESGCLAGDSLVSLADGSAAPIRELVGRNGFEVWAMDPHTLKLGPATVSHVFATGRKPVYRLGTRLGHIVRATANHRFYTLDGWRRLDELKPGTHLAVPRCLPDPAGPPPGKAPLATPAPMTVAEAGLLGHLIGDGRTLPRHCLLYTTREPELAAIVEGLTREAFGERVTPRARRERNWYQVYLASASRLTHGRRNPVAAWLDGLGVFGLRSYEKRVPAALHGQPADVIAAFLRHLWSTDGCIRPPAGGTVHPAIYYATSSEGLSHDVQRLLLRLGIVARRRAVPQGGKGRAQFHVIVSGKADVGQFAATVRAVGEARPARLADCVDWLATRPSNTNRDLVPAAVWRSTVVPAMRRNGMTTRRIQAAMGMARYCGTALYQCGVSRGRLDRVERAVGGDERLRYLAQSDLYWDEIVSIDSDGEEEVYDLTVPGASNFIANNLVVHNSIEQDADVIMLLHREDYYRMSEPDFQPDNIAEVIIAKQRNGPTGTVKLAFLNKTTRFENLATQADPF